MAEPRDPSPRTGRATVLIGALQLTAAVVDGLALSTIVLHVTLHLHLAAAVVGLVLALAAGAALVLAVPLGALADRLGLRTAAALFAGLTTLALFGYAGASSLGLYATAAVVFVVAQAAGGAVRQALAVGGVPPDRRLRTRATMHTLLNTGLGLGTVVGAVITAAGGAAVFRGAYVAAAVAAAVTAMGAFALPRPQRSAPEGTSTGGALVAWRDRRFAIATALAALIQLTMPVLSVLLPVWVPGHTDAPAWVAAAALGVNTVLVIAFQRPWTSRVTSPTRTAVSASVAAAGLLVAGVLLALSSARHGSALAAVEVVVAVCALTVGEIGGGAASWSVALTRVPADAEGRYQSAYSMSASAARILGPALGLPLVVGLMPGGWLVLAVVMALACLGVALLARGRRPAPAAAPG